MIYMHDVTEIAIPIPFYSQRVDFKSENLEGFRSPEDAIYWQERGCGIACLKMILDGFRISDDLPLVPSYGELLHRGLDMGAYCERGWIHTGLVRLANEYGIQGTAFRQSQTKKLLEEVEN
jgi:hypothetical protein